MYFAHRLQSERKEMSLVELPSNFPPRAVDLGFIHAAAMVSAHGHDQDALAAPEGSEAEAEASVRHERALAEAERLRAEIVNAPLVSHDDLTALAVAGFVAADILASVDGASQVHIQQVRTALARIAQFGADLCKQSVEHFADEGIADLIEAAAD